MCVFIEIVFFFFWLNKMYCKKIYTYQVAIRVSHICTWYTVRHFCQYFITNISINVFYILRSCALDFWNSLINMQYLFQHLTFVLQMEKHQPKDELKLNTTMYSHQFVHPILMMLMQELFVQCLVLTIRKLFLNAFLYLYVFLYVKVYWILIQLRFWG